jgi:hypothetical protein
MSCNFFLVGKRFCAGRTTGSVTAEGGVTGFGVSAKLLFGMVLLV